MDCLIKTGSKFEYYGFAQGKYTVLSTKSHTKLYEMTSGR